MNSLNDYGILDHPDVTRYIFHPRSDRKIISDNPDIRDFLIPAAPDAAVGARLFTAGLSCPTILFFHGNGEIVSDYDDLGKIYTRRGINFFPVDYRGYGRSTGKPNVSSMMADCHVIYDYAVNWLTENSYTGLFVVMGRSLGSASALELAHCYKDRIDGLIIESGFAFAGPLLELLGINLRSVGFSEKTGFRNIDKIRTVDKPVLIIHAESDHIIPFSDAAALYDACMSRNKELLRISGANHNDILYMGFTEYMASVESFMQKIILS